MVVRVLVAIWMVNINISVIVINNNNTATVGDMVHVLGGVRLLLLICLLLGLNIV